MTTHGCVQVNSTCLMYHNELTMNHGTERDWELACDRQYMAYAVATGTARAAPFE